MNKENSIFENDNYKTYLKIRISHLPKQGRGFRSHLAKALRCQTAYVSQVLNGTADFNLEQALVINRLIGHTEEESRFFILLVELARAGSFDLKAFFLRQITELRENRSTIRERFKVRRSIQLEDQVTYYSEWYFSAVHVLTSIPRFQVPQEIATALQLPMSQVLRILDALVLCGLVKQENGSFQIGEGRLHLGSESPLISKHHINWRLQAMRSLERASNQDVHYTSIVSAAPEDIRKIRTMLVDCLEQFNRQIADSPAIEEHCLALDLFRMA